MELLLQLGFVALLLLVGLVFGRAAEQRHFRDIERREAEFADILVFNERTPPQRPFRQAALVVGSVVVAEDYFKRMAAALKSLVGGRLTAYESLMDRGRREAILRMKAEARARGARGRLQRALRDRLARGGECGGTSDVLGRVHRLRHGTGRVSADVPRLPR